MPHAPVSNRQRERAKALRRAMTRAEILLWRYLKAGHLDGLQFRRQTPMGRYIIDFVCQSAKLVVELDGASHDFEERLQRDQIRDRWLTSRGYTVLRFTNDDVLTSLEGVLTVIRETATARVLSAPPSLSLPRKGGGNRHTATSPVASKRGAISRRTLDAVVNAAPSLPSPASGGRAPNSSPAGGEEGPSLDPAA